MRVAALALLATVLLSACRQQQETAAPVARNTPPPLPAAGVRLEPLAPGDGMSIAEAHCLECHSTDIIRQQRLTEKQWTAAVEKMVRWGSKVPEGERARLVAYLSRNYGPESRFTPVETQPIAAVAGQ